MLPNWAWAPFCRNTRPLTTSCTRAPALSPAERNYDVGDRELLGVKLALEEWRHWLEGAEHPFTVWTLE